MKKLLLVAAVVALGWYGNQFFKNPQAVQSADPFMETEVSNFRCDGREHCSEMSSCEEATFFIRNCPNTKMDGDRDGVPCENQWCR